MAYDSFQEERINNILSERRVQYITKKMMGGLCYMVDDKMLCGLINDHLMARVGADSYEVSLTKDDVYPSVSHVRPLKGFVFVGPSGIDLDDDLAYWIDLCLDFNPKAKSSKKKKK